MRLRAFICFVVLVAAGTFAIAISPGTAESHTATPDTSNAKEEAEVGWQSIFWGLFTLALNAMTQPSVLDREFTRQPNILFPARSSPLVCAADALEIIVKPLFLVVIKRQSLGNAARFTRLQRFPDAVESVWQLYPWALINFLPCNVNSGS